MARILWWKTSRHRTGLQLDLTDEGTRWRSSEGRRGSARPRALDLIILDVMLPGRDGFEVCRDLRRRGFARRADADGEAQEAEKVVGLDMGPTTTSPSRSARVSFAPVSGRCSAGRRPTSSPCTGSDRAKWTSPAPRCGERASGRT